MRVVGDENNSQSFRINGDQAPIEDASSIEREKEKERERERERAEVWYK